MLVQTVIISFCFLALLENFFGPKDAVEDVGKTEILRCSVENAKRIYWKRNGEVIDTETETRFKVMIVCSTVYL